MKKLLFICGLLWSAIASAQFTPGQLLTAQELNSQFALYAPLAGATYTGSVTVPTLTVTGTFTLPSSTVLPNGVTATEQGYLDNSSLVATNSFVKRSILAATGTIPISNVTGGVYNFQTTGSGAQIVILASGGSISGVLTIAAAGSGYQVGDCLLMVGGNGDAILRVTSLSGSGVAGASVVYGGTGYTTGVQLSGTPLPPGSRDGVITGTLTSNLTIIIPAGTYLQGSRRIVFNNNTTGAFTTTVKLSNGSGGSTGNGVVLLQGTNNSASTILYTDGQNDVWPANSSGGLTYLQGSSGSVSRSLTNKLQDVVSVKDFGALCNGSTDDSSAIQAALNSGVSAVYIPAGTCVAGNLTMPSTSGFVLYGAGTASILKQNSSVNPLISWSHSSINYQEGFIRDLSFDGTNGAANTIDTTGVGGETLQNLYFTNVPTGFSSIYVNGTASTYVHDMALRNIQIYSSTSGLAGVRWGPLASDSTISQFVMNGNFDVQYGMYYDGGAQSIRAAESHPYNTSKNIVLVNGTSNNLSFDDFVFDNSDLDNVEVFNSSALTFNNCYFEATPSGFSSLLLSGTAGASLYNTVFSASSGAVSAVVESGGSTDTKVVGGLVQTPANYSAAFALFGTNSYYSGLENANPLAITPGTGITITGAGALTVGVNGSVIQNNSYAYGTDTGSANAYAVAYTPAVTSLTSGMELMFEVQHTNTGASTFSPNGLTAEPIVGGDNAALQGGELTGGSKVRLQWKADSTDWVIQNSSAGSLQIVPASATNQAVNLGQLENGTLTITPAQAGGIVGTTTNNNANAGSVGEYLSNTGSAVSLTSGSPTTVATITLTAGDWDVWGSAQYVPAGTTIITNELIGANTSNAIPASFTQSANWEGTKVAGQGDILNVSPFRVTSSGSQTYDLVVQGSFTTSTCTANAIIQARRRR